MEDLIPLETLVEALEKIKALEAELAELKGKYDDIVEDDCYYNYCDALDEEYE